MKKKDTADAVIDGDDNGIDPKKKRREADRPKMEKKLKHFREEFSICSAFS